MLNIGKGHHITNCISAKCHAVRAGYVLERYGVPSVSKTLKSTILVYLPLIYKYDTDLTKYLPDLYISGSDL